MRTTCTTKGRARGLRTRVTLRLRTICRSGRWVRTSKTFRTGRSSRRPRLPAFRDRLRLISMTRVHSACASRRVGDRRRTGVDEHEAAGPGTAIEAIRATGETGATHVTALTHEQM